MPELNEKAERKRLHKKVRSCLFLVIEDKYAPFWEISVETCERCIPVDNSIGKIEEVHPEIPVEWICVGLCRRPDTPSNSHDANNRIRACHLVVGSKGPIIERNEYTAWEANVVGGHYVRASSYFLKKFQPGAEDPDIEIAAVFKEREQNDGHR